MDLIIENEDVWAATLDDKPGDLASRLSVLAQAGVECTTFTRADRADLPREVVVEPGHRVVHIEAGPHHLPKEALPEVTDEFRRGMLDWFARNAVFTNETPRTTFSPGADNVLP